MSTLLKLIIYYEKFKKYFRIGNQNFTQSKTTTENLIVLLDFAKRKVLLLSRIYLSMYACMYLSVRACVRTFTVLQ